METLSRFSPEIEIYSIDEAFLSLYGIKQSLLEYGKDIKKTVYQWTGIPVSVGIAKTKVLSKVANELAKKGRECKGVCDLSLLSESEMDNILKDFPVDEIWGIGKRYASKLKKHGINSALKLKHSDIRWVRKHMTVVGEKLVRELRGTQCLDVETVQKNKKEITCSRSFGKKVTDITEIKEAVSKYMTTAVEKLRKQKSVCSGVYVFIMTSYYDKNRYYKGSYRAFPVPTADTSHFIMQAMEMVDKIFLKGKKYAKAGVVLAEISKINNSQRDFFSPAYKDGKNEKLMSVLDVLNRRMGRDTIEYASSGTKRVWSMSRGLLSCRYTTSWKEIPVART